MNLQKTKRRQQNEVKALQKQLADLKSQLNLNNRIENIKKGIVEALLKQTGNSPTKRTTIK